MLSLTAVVWDADSDAYVLRTYTRDDADGAALLTHVGRALVTEFVLRVGANSSLRCLSRTDIPAGELFAAPGGDGRTLRELPGRGGTAGGDLVRVHRVPLVQGVECRADPPAHLPACDLAVQLSLLGQRADRRRRPRRADGVRRRLVSGSGAGRRPADRGLAGTDDHAVGGHLGPVEEHAAVCEADDAAGDGERVRGPHLTGPGTACRSPSSPRSTGSGSPRTRRGGASR